MGTGYLILPARFRVSRRRLHLTSAHYLILPARFRVSRRHLHLTSPFPLKMRRFARKNCVLSLNYGTPKSPNCRKITQQIDLIRTWRFPHSPRFHPECPRAMLELSKFQVHPMPRPKRGSTALEKAEKRLASLKSISSTLDLGDGLTLASYQ